MQEARGAIAGGGEGRKENHEWSENKVQAGGIVLSRPNSARRTQIRYSIHGARDTAALLGQEDRVSVHGCPMIYGVGFGRSDGRRRDAII